MARAQAPTDEYVTAVVLARLSRPDVLELLAERPDEETSEAVAELARLRARYREFEEQAVAGQITAASWARIEARVLDQIKTLERRTRPRDVPRALTELVGVPDADVVWDTLSVPQRREVIRTLLVPRILPAGKGSRTFDPALIEIEWR